MLSPSIQIHIYKSAIPALSRSYRGVTPSQKGISASVYVVCAFIHIYIHDDVSHLLLLNPQMHKLEINYLIHIESYRVCYTFKPNPNKYSFMPAKITVQGTYETNPITGPIELW